MSCVAQLGELAQSGQSAVIQVFLAEVGGSNPSLFSKLIKSNQMKQVVFFTKVLSDNIVVGCTNDSSFAQRVDDMKALLSSTNPGSTSFIELKVVIPIVTGGVDLSAIGLGQASGQDVSALQQKAEEVMSKLLSSAGQVQY